MNSRARIFQIGFNKCGTTTLHRFFRDNGINSIHWENGEIAVNFHARSSRGEDPFADYPDVAAFTDMIKVRGSLLEPYKSFEEIYRWYPDSYFILNTRNASDWIESRVRHGLVPHYRAALGLPDDARRYDVAKAMLDELGVGSIRLMTNNPDKVEGLRALGVTVESRVPVLVRANSFSNGYLETKRTKMGHTL